MQIIEDSLMTGYLLFCIPVIIVLLLTNVRWLKAAIVQTLALLYVVSCLIWMYLNYDDIPSVTYFMALVAGWILFMICLAVAHFFSLRWHNRTLKAPLIPVLGRWDNPLKHGYEMSDIIFSWLMVISALAYMLVVEYYFLY